MVQNADDAGAGSFRVLLDLRSHGTDALLAPGTAGFQGPALVTYNDAVFTDRDFESIQHIGGSRKTDEDSKTKTGRFGVGFNSSYHVTDLPCFVSRKFLVMLDPHCAHLPNGNTSEPGKMVNFLKPGLRAKYADQFTPFCVFGCTMAEELRGTIFRLPLRTSEQAAASRISPRPCTAANAEELLTEFAAALPELALFLTHIHTVEASVWRPGAAEPTLVRRLRVADASTGRAPNRQRLHALVRSAMHDLRGVGSVEDTMRLSMHAATASAGGAGGGGGVGAESDAGGWLVTQSMGGGRAREMSISKEVAAFGLQPVPWGGVAARLSLGRDAGVGVGESGGGGGSGAGGVSIGARIAVHGRPYCLLPLPSSSGLPVHVNGFFELSSNRRDIWYGDDLVGVGKMRSDWNVALLQDVVAPSYVKLLHAVQADLEGRSEQYYQLWPQQRPAEPWGLLVDKLYASLLDQPVLWTDASGGRWVSPTEAVFAEPADEGDEAAAAIRASLVRSGMDLVVAPKPVLDLLQLAARSAGVMLTTANARTVRLWFQGDKDRQADLSVKEGTALLTHCLRDVGTGFVGGATAVDLIG